MQPEAPAPEARLTGKDRLIVALDVPSADDAVRVIECLDNVTFFKVGLQLLMTGALPAVLRALGHKRIFVDLKLPSDIANTVAAVVDLCIDYGVKFLTLSESMSPQGIAAARRAREARATAYPQLLTVPYLSSADERDLASSAPSTNLALDDYIVERASAAIRAGCDGIIVSGSAIGPCRQRFASPVVLVSPGIRPAGAPADDQKRHTTPADAIRLGADYLVVGRPILKDGNPREAADRIIREIDAALVS